MNWTSLFILRLIFPVIAANSATLKKIAVIELPGPPGQHFDHLAMDYQDHYLLDLS